MHAELAEMSPNDLLELPRIARILGLAVVEDSLDGAVAPRGYRLLSKVPRVPVGVIDRLVNDFGSLQRLLAAGVEELLTVYGVGELRARTLGEGLSASRSPRPRALRLTGSGKPGVPAAPRSPSVPGSPQ